MKRVAQYIVLCTLSLCIFSCRPESDNLLSYGYNDAQVFDNAESSFEQQFISFWTAMNCNYGIWDYEDKMGVNWDAIYKAYLPKFKALDEQEEVTDEEVANMYGEIINSLHDGHLYIQIKNIKTGHFLYYMPGQVRNMRRDDYAQASGFQPNLSAYSSQTGDNHLLSFSSVNTSPISAIVQILNTVGHAVVGKMDEYEQKSTLTESEQFIYDYCTAFKADCDVLETITSNSRIISYYNDMCSKYEAMCQFLQVEMPQVDNQLASHALTIESGLFEPGIPYLRISGFKLSPYLNDNYFKNFADTANTNSKAFQVAVKSVWHEWFDKIQELKSTQSLRGVIIDVRSNGGGFVNDYQYVLGALLPSGGFTSHQLRTKNGTGRYDYSPLMDFTFPTYPSEHETVTEPIVVLANCSSVSMAEMTAWGAKKLSNGHVIGMRTWGGLSALSTDPSSYSQTYASAFGEENKTAFYAYIPKFVAIFPEVGVQEGVGIIPDIEVPFDQDLYDATGRDSQLERAIEYILTGN